MNARIRKSLIIVVVMGLVALVVQVLGISAASAHDAPPHGSATCQTTGPLATWEVTNGTAVVQDAGSNPTTVAITSTAGTVTQSPSATVHNTGDGSSYTYSVTGIPIGTASITVSATTKWFEGGGGTDVHTVVISEPTSNCVSQVTVPGAPTPTPPTCSAAGSPAVPANTDSVHWSLSGNTATATAQTGYQFSDGKTVETYVETIQPKLTGDQCATATTPVSPTITEPVCTTPGNSTTGSFTLPADGGGITYTKSGNTVTATADSTVKFLTVPSGWTLVDSHHATYVVSYTSAGSCTVTVIPTAPMLTEPACTGPGTESAGSFTLPANTAGLTYYVGSGSVVAALSSGYVLGTLPEGWVAVEGGAYYPISYVDAGSCLVKAPPVEPTVVQSVCTGPGTSSTAVITPATTVGVEYSVSGNVVTATLDAGYRFPIVPNSPWVIAAQGDSPFPTVLTDTVTLTSAGDCLVTSTPVTPTVSGGDCLTADNGGGYQDDYSVVIPDTTGVVYQVGTEVVTGTLDVPAGDQVVVTAVPATGYQFGDETTTVFTFDDTATDCSTLVTPVLPTLASSTCDTSTGVITYGAVVLPADTAGITYSNVGDVVTATLSDGYEFGDISAVWTVADDNASASYTLVQGTITCTKTVVSTPTPTPTPSPKPTAPVAVKVQHSLAYTGFDSTMFAGLGVLTLLVGGLLVFAGRRRRGNHAA
jgi:hypothetical protein